MPGCISCDNSSKWFACTNKYIWNITKLVCDSCSLIYAYCETCSNTTCFTCPYKYGFNSSSICVLCSILYPFCYSCSSINCLACINDMYYLSNNNTCTSCSDNPDLLNCKRCTATYCYECLTNVTYYTSSKCLLCNATLSQCSTCANSTYCYSCTNSTYALKRYSTNYTENCLLCDLIYPNCSTCNITNCLSCKAGNYL